MDVNEILMALPEGGAETASEGAEDAAEPTTETEAVEATDEAEATDADKPTEPVEPAAVDVETLLSDEALSTPEGIKAAADWLRSRERTTGKDFRVLKKREKRFAAERQAFERDKGFVATVHKQQLANAEALRSGNAKQVIEALTNITGRPGAEIYNEITHLMLSDGKSNGRADPAVEKMNAKVAELERRLAERDEQNRIAELDQQIERGKDVVLNHAKQADKYPAIARYIAAAPENAAEVREFLADYVIRQDAAGVPVTAASASAYLNKRLSAVFAASPAQDGGPARGNPVSQKPKARAISPGATTRREITEEESLERLASDPDFMGALFG